MAQEARITLRVEDGTTVDAARVATALGRELVHEGVAVSTASGSAPQGAKSGIVITAGSLVITGAVSAQAVRSIAQIVMAAMRRGVAGRIHFEDGDRKFDMENGSRDSERALVAWLTSSSSLDQGGE
jgi:hypothetical protein